MMAKSIAPHLLLLILVGFPLWAKPSPAQDREQMIEKILNPMPDYDPFEGSTARTPQFFPDEGFHSWLRI